MAVEAASTGQTFDSPASAGLHAVPLFHAAWLFAAGIVVAHWLWLRPGLVIVALALVAAVCGLAVLRSPRIVWLPLAVVWLLLGAWCAEMEPHPAPTPLLGQMSDGLLRCVEGTVVDTRPVRSELEQNVDEASLTGPTQRIDLRVATIEEVTDNIDRQTPTSGAVRLTVHWPALAAADMAAPEPFRCGERVGAYVRLLPPESYHDAGAWSRVDYLLDQGVTSTASVRIDRIVRLGESSRTGLSCRLREWQHATTARLLGLPARMRSLPAPLRLSPPDAMMLAAMVAGDRTYLSRSLRVGFERTGSFHMLVVSGFHLAIVAGCLFWVARGMRLPRAAETLLTIAASFAYALFTGFAVPVQRSFWMVTLYLLGRLVYRDRNPLNLVGFAALCLLVASPRSFFDSSFQMTLLAAVAIAGIAVPLLGASVHPYLIAVRDLRRVAIDIKLPPRLAAFRVALRMIADHLQHVAGRFAAWRLLPWIVQAILRILEAVVVACVIELAMMLPMAIYFHRITLFALPVNLLILPLLFLLMPAALLTVLLLFWWPVAAAVPGVVVALVLHCGVWLVYLFGALALGDFRIPGPLLWQIMACAVLVGLAILLARTGAQRPWAWRLSWLAVLLAGAVAVVPRPVERPRGALLMEAIDVGQGDALLLITPEGKTLLVDAGGFGGGPRQATQDFDIGEEVVSPALWSRGIRHLDAVALTHAHSDHMGGMPAVLRNFRPDVLWVGNNPPVPVYKDLLSQAAGLHTQVRSLRAGDAFAFGGVRIEVLAPLRNYRPGAEPANDDSLVLRVVYGATSALLEGDAEEPVEKAMLAEPDLQSTLLKVGHHGSVTSTRPEFLARVAPKWAVISCGLHNRYGHPRQEVLAELQRAGVRTLHTDTDGASCFVLDGNAVKPDYQCGWRW